MPETISPLVGIVMGSDSDWPKIKAVAAALDEFGVAYEVQVMSAHRTPEVVRQYATMAAARGCEVLIAAAGGAAHLAGVVASHTVLPVIGIPVPTELQGGLDSLALDGADARRRARGHRGRRRRRGRATPACWPSQILALARGACKRNSSPSGTAWSKRSAPRTPPCKPRFARKRDSRKARSAKT